MHATFFVTVRLVGSLPQVWRDPIDDGREETDPGQREERLRQALERFRESERILDAAERGPVWLGDPAIASLVCGCLHHGDGQLYRLHRYVVMPNHVHVLLQPLALGEDDPHMPSLALIMQRMKRFSAQRANAILGRTGPFWQHDHFDHCIRDDQWYRRFVDYIDANPVLAGLADEPAAWPWSTAGEEAAA